MFICVLLLCLFFIIVLCLWLSLSPCSVSCHTMVEISFALGNSRSFKKLTKVGWMTDVKRGEISTPVPPAPFHFCCHSHRHHPPAWRNNFIPNGNLPLLTCHPIFVSSCLHHNPAVTILTSISLFRYVDVWDCILDKSVFAYIYPLPPPRPRISCLLHALSDAQSQSVSEYSVNPFTFSKPAFLFIFPSENVYCDCYQCL